MRRLWLLRYGRPFILVAVIATLAFLQEVQTLAMHINMFGSNRTPFETFILFASDPYVLFAMAATITALTPIGREAVDWISQKTSNPAIGLILRIPLVALLVALSFSRPDHQYQLVSRAAAGSSSPAASGRIICAILGATYFLPLAVLFGVLAIISQHEFLLAVATAVFTILVSTGLSIVIVTFFHQAPPADSNTPVVQTPDPDPDPDPDRPKLHSLPSIIFWTTLTAIAMLFTVMHSPTLVAALTLAASIIVAVFYRALKPRVLLTITGTYFATLVLYGAIIIASGVLSQLLTISGLLQDFAFEYQRGNRVVTMLIICSIVFVFSSIFGTLASAVSLGSSLLAISFAMGFSGPWPLISLLIVLKIASTVSPVGFINNAASVDTPIIRGYIGRLRILFPIIAADVIVFAVLIAVGSALPQL